MSVDTSHLVSLKSRTLGMIFVMGSISQAIAVSQMNLNELLLIKIPDPQSYTLWLLQLSQSAMRPYRNISAEFHSLR